MSSHNFEILKFDSWKNKKIPAQFEELSENHGMITCVNRLKDCVEFNWGDSVIMEGNKRTGNKLVKYCIHGFENDMVHVIIQKKGESPEMKVPINWLIHIISE